jgi:hypothetical protein
MAVIEIQAVVFVVAGERNNGHGTSALETCYDGFIKWRTESGYAATGRNLVKAWLIFDRDEIDLTEEMLSGKVSYRAA